MALFVSGKTDKNPLSYRCGEKMQFTLTLTDGCSTVPCAWFQWHIRGDDGQVSDGSCPGETGVCHIEASISTPGFVEVTAQAFNWLGEPLGECAPFNGGAGAEVETLTLGVPEPEDFDAFWQGVRDTLAGITPRTLEMVEVPATNEACRVYDVKVYAGEPEALGGTPENRFGIAASGYVSIPKGVDEGKTYPIWMHFMGYSFTGATPAENGDAIVCLFNPHGLPNGRPQEEYDRLAAETVGTFGFSNEHNRRPEDVYFKGMIMRNVLAVRWAQTISGWNGKDLVLHGGSMGAFQATSATALSPEVTELRIDIPWMCDLGGVTRGRLPGWLPKVEENGEPIMGIRYYDTTSFAARVTCPVYLSAGLGDYCCPPSTGAVLYNRITAPKRMEWRQNRTHGYTAPDAEPYIWEEKMTDK